MGAKPIYGQIEESKVVDAKTKKQMFVEYLAREVVFRRRKPRLGTPTTALFPQLLKLAEGKGEQVELN